MQGGIRSHCQPFPSFSGYSSPPPAVRDRMWLENLGQLLPGRREEWEMVDGLGFLSISFTSKLLSCYSAWRGIKWTGGIGLKSKGHWAGCPDPTNNERVKKWGRNEFLSTALFCLVMGKCVIFIFFFFPSTASFRFSKSIQFWNDDVPMGSGLDILHL